MSGCNVWDNGQNLSSDLTTNAQSQFVGSEQSRTESEDINLSSANQAENNQNLLIEILNAGQADCILITLPGNRYILIDGGNNNDGQKLVDYLKSKTISNIDFVIATHPHEDHIGGLDLIISSFDIGKIYMPKIHDSDVPTTKTYEDFLDAVSNRGYKISPAKAGSTLLDEGNLKLEFFAPNSDNYNNLNNYSAVIKLTYGNTRVLFAGDAENVSENEMLKAGFNLKCDILKVGHHGSNSSTTKEFLEAVDPKEAIISCGMGNQYGHPHAETLQKLQAAGINIHRTDQDGTVIITLDGNSYTISKHKDINIDGN
ncbi:MAG TPA: MBL fold metallo-hydrolase [Clostridiales bacterium]|nr:MBL fold metallo-hydrolase [Clostridiales bacterium]